MSDTASSSSSSGTNPTSSLVPHRSPDALRLSLLPRELIQIIFYFLTDGDLLFFRCASSSTRKLVLKFAPNILDRCKGKLYFYAACSVSLLEWCYTKQRIPPRRSTSPAEPQPITAAAAAGNLEALRWLIVRGQRIDPSACCEAARRGHRHIIEYLPYFEVKSTAVIAAVEGNQIEMVKFLFEKRNLSDTCDDALAAAIRANNKDMIHYFLSKTSPTNRIEALKAAVERGAIDMLEELLPRDWYHVSNALVESTIQFDQYAVYEWIVSKGIPSAPFHHEIAIRLNKIDFVKYLRSKGVALLKPNRYAHLAIQRDHLEMLKYLLETTDALTSSASLTEAIFTAKLNDRNEIEKYLTEFAHKNTKNDH